MGRVAYDTESYRNAAQKNGIAASLMDYARFNYIAQPGDEGVRFISPMKQFTEKNAQRHRQLSCQ
jgi:hypothetical protein